MSQHACRGQRAEGSLVTSVLSFHPICDLEVELRPLGLYSPHLYLWLHLHIPNACFLTIGPFLCLSPYHDSEWDPFLARICPHIQTLLVFVAVIKYHNQKPLRKETLFWFTVSGGWGNNYNIGNAQYVSRNWQTTSFVVVGFLRQAFSLTVLELPL